ncbi:hypothetical protein BZA70DRAFT_58253 [Myxozyma melibiosi]|uniref:Uncharacterized protein n=1 Tax=Myxozyma melibiosi TaxID=54550 RepID=A0ABR1F1J7_9ASCO
MVSIVQTNALPATRNEVIDLSTPTSGSASPIARSSSSRKRAFDDDDDEEEFHRGQLSGKTLPKRVKPSVEEDGHEVIEIDDDEADRHPVLLNHLGRPILRSSKAAMAYLEFQLSFARSLPDWTDVEIRTVARSVLTINPDVDWSRHLNEVEHSVANDEDPFPDFTGGEPFPIPSTAIVAAQASPKVLPHTGVLRLPRVDDLESSDDESTSSYDDSSDDESVESEDNFRRNIAPFFFEYNTSDDETSSGSSRESSSEPVLPTNVTESEYVSSSDSDSGTETPPTDYSKEGMHHHGSSNTQQEYSSDDEYESDDEDIPSDDEDDEDYVDE